MKTHSCTPLELVSGTYCPKRNRLLAALSEAEYERLLPQLEFVSLPLSRVIHEAGARCDHVYFPISSMISLLYILEDASSAETAVIGREGLIGIGVFMASGTSLGRAVVQRAGCGYRLKAAVALREFERSGTLQQLALRYTLALMAQTGQTAACNRHHSVEQQLCRWLLLSLDRSDSKELTMTHELIANNLGVRREGVTQAARRLQEAGSISYRRGHITVLDRAKLEAQVCECYGAVKGEYDRLLSIERFGAGRLAPGTSAAATRRASPRGSELFSDRPASSWRA